MVVDSGRPPQPVLGVFLMKKTLLTSVTALFLATGTAYASEWWTNKELQDPRTECVQAGTETGGVIINTGKDGKRFKSPAELFEFGRRRWEPVKLTDNGDEVIVAYLGPFYMRLFADNIAEDGPEIWTPKYHFFRTQKACETARKAAQDKWDADNRKASEAYEAETKALDKYR